MQNIYDDQNQRKMPKNGLGTNVISRRWGTFIHYNQLGERLFFTRRGRPSRRGVDHGSTAARGWPAWYGGENEQAAVRPGAWTAESGREETGAGKS